MSTRRDDATTSDDLAVRFPELPVASYLRLLAWSDRATEVIVNDPALDSVARANGVHVLDRSYVGLAHRCRAAFCDEAAKAVRAGRSTMAPTVSAPRRLWRVSLATYERGTAWLARFGHDASPIPAPTREVEATQRRLHEALRTAYGAA
jgi:hypothetical protein